MLFLAWITFALLLFLIFFAGCAAGISERSEETDGFGSVTIASPARTVNVSSILFARAFVSGSGIAAGSEPTSSLTSVSGGKTALTISNIPIGSNRVVTVYAYRSENEQLDENAVVLRAVLDPQ